VFSAPAPCAGNLLVVPSCDGSIYALNRRTGKRIWTFKGAGGAYHASPVARGKTIYVGNDDGRLYAVNEVSGQLRWASDLQSPIWANPLLVPGMVMAGTLDGHLFAVRRTDGAILWRYKAGKRIYLAALHFWQEKVLAATLEGVLHAVDAESGRKAWTWKMKGGMAGGPAREEDTIFAVTTSGVCAALDLRKRRTLWSRRLGGGTLYTPAVTPTSVLTGTGSGLLYSLDRKTGAIQWRKRTPKRTGCVAADARRVFSCSWNGNVYAYSASRGEPLWTLKTDADVRSFPTLYGGWLYIGSLDKSIYAVKYL
jgi:outer membrane protein assembly factor BamB